MLKLVPAHQGEDALRAARGRRRGWPSWGPAQAWYLVWVDGTGGLGSMMIVETETPRFVEGMRARFFDHLSRSTRLDRSADDLVVLLHVLMVDDHIVGPAFGPLGEADAECTPLARMREYALSELRLPQGAV